MSLEDQIKLFTYALEHKRWGDVSSSLAFILNASSTQEIDRFVSGLSSSFRPWIELLSQTGLYKDGKMGEYLAKQMILRVWKESSLDCRWPLLIAFLALYDVDLVIDSNIDAVLQNINTIHEGFGMPVAEIIELFIYHAASDRIVGIPAAFTVQ